MSDSVNILTPVGRLVQGSPFKPQTTDAEGRPLVIKSGANAGQPRVSYFVALAVTKTDPGITAVLQQIAAVARQAFPQFFDAAGNCNKPGFAFKFEDGDSQVPNANGIKPCDRPGWAGCWVLKFTNGFAPKCYTKGGAAIITNPDEIKCGYYARIYASVAGNESTQQPGVYLNCSMIELVGYGEEITFGPSGDQVFGAAPAVLPAGASTVPLAPKVPLAAPAIPGVPVLPPAAPALPVNVTPAPDFLRPPVATVVAPPPPAPVPAPAPEEYYIAPNGARVSKTALVGAGWTEAQIATLKRG